MMRSEYLLAVSAFGWLCSCGASDSTVGSGGASNGTGAVGAMGTSTTTDGSTTGGSSTGEAATGGSVTGAGGVSAGGTPSSAGGSSTGGAATGGTMTGGSHGGPATGGASAGGTATGGASAGGTATGGASAGGTATGGASAGGTATGGASAGVTATGGATAAGTGGTTAQGGSAGSVLTGGTETGGATTGGVPGSGGTSGSSGSGGSSNTVGCDRGGLQAAVDSYIAAMEAGNASSLPLAASATYEENGSAVALGGGLWATALHADQTLSLLDVTRCASFTEVIITSGSHDYVNGVRIDVTGSEISAISIIATDADDWGFDGDTYLNYSSQEVQGGGWDEVPSAERYTYDELQAAGEAYFAYWADKSFAVPWGVPCARLEGGMYTGYRAGADCSVGVPDQSYAPQPNDALVDVDRGMAVIFVNLPGPDSHLFRVQKQYPDMESPGIRYIHTLTICYVDGQWQCPGDPPAG